MRVGNLAASRPFYHDRSPIQIAENTQQGGVAPHVFTVRQTYTVPSNRKAFVGAATAETLRITAAGTPGSLSTSVNVTPSGGSRSLFVAATLGSGSNGLGDSARQAIGGSALLLAGDILEIGTQDSSLTGTATYIGGYAVLEFDA